MAFKNSTLFLITLLFYTPQVLSAPITVTHVSDLDFGKAFLGDPQKTVAPGNSENAENASFRVTGDPNRRFNINLPKSINMISVKDNSTIRVRNFRSQPKTKGRLNINGEAYIYVGARRDAINANQTTGRYIGTFVIDVIY